MVAVWTVVAWTDLNSCMGLVVHGLELVIVLLGILARGIEEHDAFVATAKHVYVAE